MPVSPLFVSHPPLLSLPASPSSDSRTHGHTNSDKCLVLLILTDSLAHFTLLMRPPNGVLFHWEVTSRFATMACKPGQARFGDYEAYTVWGVSVSFSKKIRQGGGCKSKVQGLTRGSTGA